MIVSADRRNHLSWVVSGLFCLCLAGCSGETNRPASTGRHEPEAGDWTMDVQQMQLRQTPAAGRVQGQPFNPDGVRFEGGALQLRQGKDFFPEVEVVVNLFDLPTGTLPEGKTYEVAAARPFGASTPHVTMSARHGQELPKTELIDKYAMKLEFDKPQGGRLSGRIYLCVQDEAKSFIAGSFSAEIIKSATAPLTVEEAPFIEGRITLKGQDKYNLQAGYQGQTATGKSASDVAGTLITVGQFGMWASSTTNKPRITTLLYDKDLGCRCRCVKLEPGQYLVFARWNKHFADWRIVDVKEGGQLTVDLTIDTATAGKLEVVAPAATANQRIRILPLDKDGKLPAFKGPLEQAAWWAFGDLEVKDGKALANEMRAGRYRLVLDKATADVEIKAGATAKVELKAP